MAKILHRNVLKFSGLGFFLVSVLGLVAASLFYTAHAQTPWYDTDWQYRQKITVASAQVDANLTDFPVYQDLSEMQTGFFSNVQSDGADIRITEADGTTEIAREVVAIDTSGNTGELHFKAPSLSSGNDTEFYIYYGNPNANAPTKDSTYGSQNVWTNGYEAVYHFQEDPTPAPSLLSNASAEDGLTGWTNTGDASYESTGEVDNLTPLSSLMFEANAGSEALLHQDVDLLAAGYTTSELDSGNISFQFSGYQGNSFPSDTGQLIMEFRDGGGAVLATSSTPLQEITPEDIFKRVSVTDTAPTGTRTIRVQLRAVLVSGSAPNTAFDELYLSDASTFRGSITDSTANQLHGRSHGGMTSADLVGGQLNGGNALVFDGVNDFLDIPTSFNPSSEPDWTLSMWFQLAELPSVTDDVSLFSYLLNDGNADQLFYADNDDRIKAFEGANSVKISTGQPITANTWFSAASRHANGGHTMISDGVNRGSEASYEFTDSTERLGIFGQTRETFKAGRVDEARVMQTAPSNEWISTKYNNQSSPATFTTASPEEQVPAEDNTTGEMSSPNYTMLRSSINAGGREDGTSTNYGLTDTLGQSTPPGGQSSTTYDLQAGYRKMVAQEIAITINSPNDVTLTPDISGVSGGTGNGQVTWTTTTNNPDGYELSIKADSDPALQNTEGDVFTDFNTTGDPDYTFTTGPSESLFGFTPEGADIAQKYLDDGTSCNTGSMETSGRCWSGLSTTDETIAESTEANTDGADTIVKFRAEVGNETLQPPGEYEATVTATAVVK